jgi:uncharacterized protein (TIGR01777 family)
VKIVLAGGSGTLGRRIADHLRAKQHEIVVLTRNNVNHGPDRRVVWDGRTVGPWSSELNGAAVINLAGLLVDRRPTAKNIELLTRSRVEPTLALAHAAAGLDEPVVTWIQMSTLAIYGDRGDEILDELARPADGPPQMAGVARAWEAAAVGAPAQRQVVLRTGIVLDRDTHALNRLSALVRWGLGGRVGGGRQWVSWLHIDDFLAVVCLALDDPSMSGIVHATSPEPVRNVELMTTLRRVLRRPWSPPTPAALVHAGARLLRTDAALALSGRRCIPARLSERNFHFAQPTLKPALTDLLGDHERRV